MGTKEKDIVLTLRVFEEGEATNQELELVQGESLRIGRLKENELVLKDTNVSRFHAVLNASRHGVTISDLGSMNGTLLNGKRLTSTVCVADGDRVEIGNARIEVHRRSSEDETGQEEVLKTEAIGMQSAVITVLLADVAHYTRMSEVLPMEDVTQMLQRTFDLSSDSIAAHGGEVDKYIGDCVMALWTGPRGTESTLAKKAVSCAREVAQQLSKLISSGVWQHQEQFPWHLRFAVNSGEALLGSIGARESREFTVLGDTVNVVFRLEKLTGKLGRTIILSEATAKLIATEYQVQSLGKHEVEGRNAPVEIFAAD